MALFRRSSGKSASPSIVLLQVAGRADDLPRLRYPLGPGEDTIGRDEGCTIQVLDPGISRRQLTIAFDVRRGGFVAADLGSTNGSYLNGERLREPTVLADGDVIEIGRSRLLFTSQHVEGEMGAMPGLKAYGERGRHTKLPEQES